MSLNEKPLPFYYKDKQLMENLLKEMRLAIKDSDAFEEKQMVGDFLKRVSEALLFVAIGSSGVGKSTFLNKLFQSALFDGKSPVSTANIKEYRYGVSEATVCVNKYTIRVFRDKKELEGLQIVDMQGIDEADQDDLLECVKEYLYKSSVLFAIFDVRSIKDYAVWDLLENVETRKVIFVLTKCDLEKPHVVEEREDRLRQYMKEAGLQAPVFRISSDWEDSFPSLREYVSREIIGSNPTLTKQQENLTELRKLLGQLSESFECRKRQYESDEVILNHINDSLDTFILNNRIKIDDLKAALSREIESEIDAYQNEVICKLDPHKMKERFPNGSTDFIDYLTLINESYRKRMTDNINRKTQETVQLYLSGLEGVYEQAVGCLKKRENILALKDKFYGSMAESKKSMVYRATTQMEVTRDYYHTLSDASTELFMKLWMSRGRYDRIVMNSETAGRVAGTAGGAGAGLAVANVFGAALGKGVVTALGMIFWPAVGAIIGAAVIASIAKKIASANTLPQLEKKTAEAVAEFREEVAKTKAEMTTQILETVERMFRQEIETMDRSFSDFRMSVNIEGRNISMLEDRMRTIHGYLQEIKELE